MDKKNSSVIKIPIAGLQDSLSRQKLTAALEALPYCEKVHINEQWAEITGDVTLDTVEKLLSTLGYQVMPLKKISLHLQGLSCGKCIAKIETALIERGDIFNVQISKTELHAQTTTEAEEIIKLIKLLGYTASVSNQQNVFSSNKVSTTEKILHTDQGEMHHYLLEGISCASCVKTLEDAMRKVPHVHAVSINLATKTATVWGNATAKAITTAVAAAGYRASLNDDAQSRRLASIQKEEAQYQKLRNNATLALLVGIPLMLSGFFGISMQVETVADQIGWGIIALITGALLATVGRDYFLNAWQALQHGRATMDTLVSLGTGAAWLYSSAVVIMPDAFPLSARHVYFEATAMILGLITLGHAIETRARSKTSTALNQLIDLQPPVAVVVEEGKERECSLADVSVGMTLRLKAGAKVPVDGEVIHGDSYIDESMLTGEPLSVHKTVGDKVHAGTINQAGTLLFTATEVGQDTMLARIIALVEKAQTSKPKLAQLADYIASIFVPLVMIIAICTAGIWFFFAPEPKVNYMLITAISVLIIACPCALGLAIPLSVTIGIGRAAELGILVRDANALQQGASINTVVLDKTGTLTTGKPQVTTICPLQSDERYLLTVAAALEKPASHPLAAAILAQAENINIPPVEQFQTIIGKGVKGQLNGCPVALGNIAMMNDLGIPLPTEDLINRLAQKAETPVFVAENGKILGILGISDPIREDSALAVKALQDLGLTVMMLTGDTQQTAEAIGQQVGITKILAELLPEQKAENIQKLQKLGYKVAMVGDGINDAPALAQADVSLALASGSDIAIESAGFTLIRHSLIGVVDALALSRATLRNMKENLFGAFIYNFLGIPIAAGILFPLTGLLLNPALAGGAMALSSITVVSNANRLRLFKLQRDQH